MSPEQFSAYQQQGFNRIPVIKQVLADLETPLSTYYKLANQPYTYLFESVHGGEKWGRYSIIGLPCNEVYKLYDHRLIHEVDGQVKSEAEVADPLAELEAIQNKFNVPHIEGLPRFNGGLVGYFGYDTVRYIERRLDEKRRALGEKPDTLNTPDILLMVSNEVVVFDNLAGCLYIVVYADIDAGDDFDKASARVNAIIQDLNKPLSEESVPQVSEQQICEADFKSGFTQAGFEAAVDRIKEYILAGDVMQVVPSQRMTIPFKAPAVKLYRALRSLNPSPYMYCLNLNDFYHISDAVS